MAYLRRRRKPYHLLVLVALYILSSVLYSQFQNDADDEAIYNSRRLLSTNDQNETEFNYSATVECNKPSISHFPRDVFTQQQRQYGAVLVHFFMAFYMFVALAFVCDDYFISSLDKICSRLDLSEDVAGATFMAAGSSAPELFTSIIGVFITKGDVGVGTVVGSAVFNLLVIIALCGLFAGQVVHLTKWPLFRDSSYYLLTIASMIWVISDNKVDWYESLVMLFMYIIYILIMKFNPYIVSYLEERERRCQTLAESRENTKRKLLQGNLVVRYTFDHKIGSHHDIIILSETRRLKWQELGMRIMLSEKFSPTTRFRAACNIMLIKRNSNSSDGYEEFENEKTNGVHINGFVDKVELSQEDDGMMTEPYRPPEGSCPKVLFWLLSLPLTLLMYITIPDCRKPRWEAWYLVTFFMSVVWIFLFSYIMVWMVCVIGYTIGVPDVIMGITFLAAGTSIPDCIASLLVAREGLGDMAVSNSIGSNIFDILIGLALPWFIKSAIMEPGHGVRINSRGMLYSVALLFASVLLTLLLVHCNKWRLDKKMGIVFTLIYLVFVSISACIEFNLFGFVNLPTCVFTG